MTLTGNHTCGDITESSKDNRGIFPADNSASSKNRRYFRLISVIEAINLIATITPKTNNEFVHITEACGRVIGEDITCDINIPGFSRSVKDGYAVVSEDLIRATEAVPVRLSLSHRISMGQGDPGKIFSGYCAYIPTGARIPEGADAVVMLEYCDELDDFVLMNRPASRGENIVMKGEDFSEGEGIINTGHKLRIQDIGLLAASGITSVPVTRMPNIGIISTGSEVVSPDEIPECGEVRDVNSYLCGSFVEERGGKAVYYGIVRDDPGELRFLMKKAAGECDAVLISGGSSKDSRDITALVLEEIGDVIAHGISIAPGKPTIIGKYSDMPVIGVPGHPASAFIILNVLAGRMIDLFTSNLDSTVTTRKGIMSNNIPSEKGREEYFRVRVLGNEVVPLYGKSGLISTLTDSDGMIRINAGCEGIEKGSEVEVIMW